MVSSGCPLAYRGLLPLSLKRYGGRERGHGMCEYGMVRTTTPSTRSPDMPLVFNSPAAWRAERVRVSSP